MYGHTPRLRELVDKAVKERREMENGQNISIQLIEVDSPPYAIYGKFVDTKQYHENGVIFYRVEGTVGDWIGKIINVPESQILQITEL